MNKEQFKNEVDYGAAMALAREMLERGIIDRQDFMRVDKMYVEKYHPAIRPIDKIGMPKNGGIA